MIFDNELDAYSLSYKLAMDNALAWLKASKLAFENGLYGQSYSLIITSFEEIGKAYISWLAANEIISLEDEMLEMAYSNHEFKTLVSDLISLQDALVLAMNLGIIEEDELWKEVTLVSGEAALRELVERSMDREDKRRLGMYVDVWEEDSGDFTVTSPKDIIEELPRKAIEEVERTHELLSVIFQFLDENPELMPFVIKNFKERMAEDNPK